MPNKLYKLSDPTYDRRIYFIVGDALKCNAVVKRKWGVENMFQQKDIASHTKLDIEGEPTVRVMWFRQLSRNPDDIGVVAHECLHCVMSAFRAIGLPPHTKSEEAYTYYLESLVRQVFEKYKK